MPGNERLQLNLNTAPAPLHNSAFAESNGLKKGAQISLFVRDGNNPILSRDHWPYPVNSVFNAGAVRLADGDTLLLCRASRIGVESRISAPHVPQMASMDGESTRSRRSLPIRVNTPKKFGASKIPESRMYRNSKNMPWRTHRLLAVVPEFRWL